ncbi:MAG: hypothetical protein HY855_16795 [Burkholderiales bacterium]|nr:hypothetical protein [Burkholderiales bacterium]
MTEAASRLPAFYDAVPPIVMHDLLAELLGAAEGGVLRYTYADAVRLAGHSCPTVAGAWLMTRKALGHLYPAGLPRRGALQVALRQALDEGVSGVLASVAGLVTGAASEGGFKGLAGQHGRRDLLRFGVPMRGEMRFTRIDTGAAIELAHNGQAVPRPAALRTLMPQALAPGADAATRQAFGQAWQDWVRLLLIEHADDPALIVQLA